MSDPLPKSADNEDDPIGEEVRQKFGDTSDKQILTKNIVELILDTFGYETACIMICQPDKTLDNAFYYGKDTDHFRKVQTAIKTLFVPPTGKVSGMVADDVELDKDCRIRECCTISVSLTESRTANLFLMNSRHTQGLSDRGIKLLRVGLHPLCSLAVLLIEHVIIPEDCEGIYRLLPLILPLYEKRMYQERIAESKQKLEEIIGVSRNMKMVKELIAMAAESDVTVLIRGETGTGKELVAKAIHKLSPRPSKLFVTVSTFGEGIADSELFGHERGAFTDATKRKEGLFRQADGGTLFLDEIGNYSHNIQEKLLRVLQERTFRRMGGTQDIKVDIRLISATNKDLELSIRDGTFREDLFYRINVFPIYLAPLREREDDILLLADHFLRLFDETKSLDGFGPEATDLLLKHRWPGNIRELMNAIETAVILCKGPMITTEHLRLGKAAWQEMPKGIAPRQLEKEVQYQRQEIDRIGKQLAVLQAQMQQALNGTTENDTGYEQDEQPEADTRRSNGLDDRQIAALRHVRENGRITNREYQELCEISRDTAHKSLLSMVDHEVLEQVGKGRSTHYVLNNG